jgi:ribosomal protein S18 acetylase RimI-like enzyme
MDARVQQSVVDNLSNRPLPILTGPFVIGYDPATDNPGVNYATPLRDADITATDVADLVEQFRAVSRKPRLEYVVSTAPMLEKLLLAAGFTVEERHEYLVCTSSTLAAGPVPAGFALREPATPAERHAMIDAQNAAFGGDATPSDADVARLTRVQSQGGVAIMAVTADRPGTTAGGGLAVAPNGGVSEVAGIAVRPEFRRRGLAGAITAEVTTRLFAAGVEVAWLEASGPDSWRVYERVGYRPTGKRLYVALEQ